MGTIENLGITLAIVGAAALLDRRARHAFHGRCLDMIERMEFGEEPSCRMCYEMHRAMHRRMDREAAGSEAS